MSYARPLPRDPRPHRRIRTSLRAALVWGIAAAAGDLVIWLLARIIGIPMIVWPDVDATPVELSALIVLGAVLFAALLAGLAVGIVGKLVKRLVRWIVIGGALVTLTSLSAPWTQPAEVPTSARIVLTLMHLVTGILVTYGLAKGSYADDRAVNV